MLKVALWGANGMAGGEMLRLISGHPSMDLAVAVSRSMASRPIWNTHPHLRQDYPTAVFTEPDKALKEDVDIVFLALPHGASWPIILEYMKMTNYVKIVDLSADARLSSTDDYIKWYGKPHEAPWILEKSVYGLAELHRESIPDAKLVSGVGCNSTCSILGLYPLAREGLIQSARIELRTGSSESGARASTGTHHPYRDRTLRIYEPFRHRHLAEIVQELELSEDIFTMTMTAAGMVRGVQMLAQVELSKEVKESTLWKIYKKYYNDEPFVSLSPAKPKHLRFPDPKLVLGSNRAVTGFQLHDDSRRLLVVSAIDNLMKGASGSAMQCANLMAGIPETSGLEMKPVYPV